MTDTDLEKRIERQLRQIKVERDPKRKAVLWKEMAKLIGQRSAARIDEMERARGLK